MANITLTEDQQRKNDVARQQLQANREFQGRMAEEQGDPASMQGKPTPTQEENDLAKLGAYVPEHEPDGSPEQPQGDYMNPLSPRGDQVHRPGQQPAGQQGTQTRAMEPGQRGRFQTRSQQPGQQPPNPNE